MAKKSTRHQGILYTLLILSTLSSGALVLMSWDMRSEIRVYQAASLKSLNDAKATEALLETLRQQSAESAERASRAETELAQMKADDLARVADCYISTPFNSQQVSCEDVASNPNFADSFRPGEFSTDAGTDRPSRGRGWAVRSLEERLPGTGAPPVVIGGMPIPNAVLTEDGRLIAQITQECGNEASCIAGRWAAIEASRCLGGIGNAGGCVGPNGEIRRGLETAYNDLTKGPGPNNDLLKAIENPGRALRDFFGW
jgi:hypothetical protein